MSRLDDLITELCPEGVEYKRLGDVCLNTANISWADNKNQTFRYIDLTSVDRATHSIGDTVAINSEKAPSRAQKVVKVDDVIFGTTRPTLKRYCFIPMTYDGQICSTGYCVLRADKTQVLPRYIYHLISTNEFDKYVEVNQRGSAYPAISDGDIKAYTIPLPSLPVQQEIVRTLDKFTTMEAELEVELEAELEARKKQYNYYRDELFTFSDNVPRKTLGEIGRVSMCKRIFKEQTQSVGDIPFYKIGTFGKEPDAFISQYIFDEYRKKYSYPKKGDVLLSAAGTIGRAVIFDGTPSYFQDSNIVWIANDEKIVLNKYLYWFYSVAKWAVSEGGTISRLYNDNIKRTLIPVPSIKEQERIVAILNRFDVHVKDITNRLSAEIAARHKQYEYYRDKLLTFKEKVS